MAVTAIETLEQWRALAAELRAAGYTLYQMQHDAREPDGFNAWFWHNDRPTVHIVTHSVAVENAVVRYKAK